MVFTCAGMSSGPSTSWTQPASAGASRSSAVARSVRTSGSAFSWMTSDAEVCRMKASSTPSFARASAMNRATSRVTSVKPAPAVSIVSLAEATISGAMETMGDRDAVTRLPRRNSRASALLQHVFLQSDDHLDQAAPDLLHEIHDLVELGVVGQLQALVVRLASGRLRLDRSRQRQIACHELLLERDVLALQTCNLSFERRALVRHRLAGPADLAAGAHRHLAGAAIKAQVAVIGSVEGIAGIVALSRRTLRESRHAGDYHCGYDDQGHTDHALSLLTWPFICARSAAAQWRQAPAAPPREPAKKGGCAPIPNPVILISFQYLTARAPILDSNRPSQYGPRGFGAAELPRSA